MGDSGDVKAIYELSPMQQGMLFHSVLEPQAGTYVGQLLCTLRSVQPAAFEQAWQRVVARHPALRTMFVWKGTGRMLQGVSGTADVRLRFEDWTGLDAAKQEAGLKQFLRKDRALGFELAKAPLMRLSLFRILDDCYEFVWTHHHLILDGWSLALVLHDVLISYEAILKGEKPEAAPVRPYQDYIEWLRKQDRKQAEVFWRRKLRGIQAPTEILPAPGGGPAEGTHASRVLHLPQETTRELENFARHHRLTLNAVVQGAWAILLSRYSGSDDVIFGATVSGRPADLAGAEQMVGMFINTIPVRTRVRRDTDIVSWLRLQQLEQAEAVQYQHCPLVDVQGWSEIARPQPLFTNILVFENYPVHSSLRENRTPFAIGNVRGIEQTNYPLTVAAGLNGSLVLSLVYDERQYTAPMAQQILRHFRTLLEAIVRDAGQSIGALALLNSEERQQLVATGAGERKSVPVACFPQIFERRAESMPEDALAVVFGDRSLTYRELDQRSNQLAHRLIGLGVGPESVVAICLDRSEMVPVALLGVLKAGGAYLPLDPSYPKDRLALVLDEARPVLVLTEESVAEALPPSAAQRLLIDSGWPSIAVESAVPPQVQLDPENLAYIIYTSGSTGRPKGAMLRHGGLANLCTAASTGYRIDEGTSVLQFASLSFDASVPDIFLTLAQGGTVHFAPREELTDLDRLHALLRQRRINFLVLPPSALNLLASDGLPDLKHVIVAGERCPREVAVRWSEGRLFTNAYGPTEYTVCTSMGAVRGAVDSAPSIGRPIENTQVYILNREMELVPTGVPGELYVGGLGLARGYFGRPDLTAARFVPDPFAPEPGRRLYRTGDLVRYRADGSLDFLGRIDDQVKIRGFRIEPGEIEAVLEAHPSVRQAAVVAREDNGNKYLVAYYVLENRDEAAPDLRRWLEGKLPAYMTPAAFVSLGELPQLPNGKVNRRALPAPDALERGARQYQPPCTPIEELLAGIWAQVLGVAQVGRNDNFFDLGGHSLLATQLISRVRRAFNREIPLRELFEHPTVAGLALAIEVALADAGAPQSLAFEAMPDGADAPLSFAQERLWFLDQLEPGSPFYNNPALLRLNGRLDSGVLERTLNEIVRRHEVLRTSFQSVEGRGKPVIARDLRVPLPVTDLRGLPEMQRRDEAIERAREEAGRAFSLATPPLIRARIFRLGDTEHLLLVVMHHIVCDGWSNSVLLAEMAALYAAFSAGRSSPLPELRFQYGDYAWWQRQRLQGEFLERQLDYWKRQLAGAPPVLELPTDRPRPPVQSFRGANYRFAFPKNLTEQLNALCRRENVTLFITLLAGFQALLSRYARQHDIVIGTPIANRNRAEVEPLIGFFVNTLVLRTDLSGDPRFRELLGRARETALGAYAHQDLPFEMLVQALQPQRNLSHAPLFQVMLTLNNTPGKAVELPGLSMEEMDAGNQAARFDLTLQLTETSDGLAGGFEYNTDLFDESTVAAMARHLQRLLQAAAADPAKRLSDLPLLGEAERARVLVECNRTECAYPAEHLVHELFEGHVIAQPQAVAVQAGSRQLTYAELDRRANQLARYLRRQGVGPELIAGILLERSLDLIVAVLAVLKAGGAYLPLDPSYPAERLAFMLRDSRAPVLITSSSAPVTQDLLAGYPGRVIRLETDWRDVERENTAALARVAKPDNLAYVIYTSGSTGQPKAAMLEHRGLCNLCAYQARAFRIGPGSRVLQFAPFSFDASVWETFMALANGGTLCLAPAERAAMDELHERLREQRVGTVTLPPSVLAALPADGLPDLETVVAAGEACTRQLVGKWARGRRFFNAYGPTETTVCASMALCEDTAAGDPPIGTPLANMQLYVLDAALEPAPAGVPGELYVGGVALARGYLRRPEKTAASFVPNPFSPHPGSRLYKTGDLVRRRPDGQVEFLGRVDQQTKLRGYRIEPGEIEAALTAIEGIREAAVVVRSEQLVAYLAGPAVPGLSELRSRLKATLPDYMIPVRFVTLPSLPMSPSGKVDRRALPEPSAERRRDSGRVPPRTEIERLLAGIWADLLRLDGVGVEDNFFELGGHSLLATQMVSRMRQAFGVEVPLRAVFEHPNLEDLARTIGATSGLARKIVHVLDIVDKLTDGEVEALLADRRSSRKAGR